MSTPNFARNSQAQNYYAVLLNEYDKETESTYCPDGFDREILERNIDFELEAKKYEISSGTGWDNERNYQGYNFSQINIYKDYGSICIGLRTNLIIKSGYYEGATLDYEFEFDIMGETFESLGDFKRVFNYYAEEDYKKGFCEILSQKAQNWIENTIDKISEDIEEVYKNNSRPLKCIAIFSNGEAIYEDYNTLKSKVVRRA